MNVGDSRDGCDISGTIAYNKTAWKKLNKETSFLEKYQARSLSFQFKSITKANGKPNTWEWKWLQDEELTLEDNSRDEHNRVRRA